MTTSWFVRAIVVLSVAGAASCGSGSHPEAGERAPVMHTVTIEGSTFRPSAVTVHAGDRVVWMNRDFFPHTATAAGTFDSGTLPPDASWTFIAGTPGVFTYTCTFHPTMTGTIRVE